MGLSTPDPGLARQLGASFLRIQPLRGLRERASVRGWAQAGGRLRLLEMAAEACHRLVVEQGPEHLGIGLADYGRMAIEIADTIQANPERGGLLYALLPNQIMGIGLLSPKARWQHLTIERQALQKICIELSITAPNWEALPVKLREDAGLIKTLVMMLIQDQEGKGDHAVTQGASAIEQMILLHLASMLNSPTSTHGDYNEQNQALAVPNRWHGTGPSKSRSKQLVEQAAAYFIEQLDQPISLEEICKNCGVSARRIQAAFKECTDKTPMQYLKQIRMQQLRRHLLTGHPVSEACQLVGLRFSGRIASAYQNQYGELPRQTLAAFNSSGLQRASLENTA